MNAVRLLEYFDRIAEAPDAVSRLRKFILDLAVRGKLVEQDQNDEPASELLKKILRQRTKLEKEGTIARIKPWCPIDPSELPCGYSDITFFARLGYLFSLQKGLTGIQGAKPGKYPLIVTASHRASCDHYDFEGSAAIIPIVSSAGHGCASINRLHYQEGKFAVGSILCAAFSLDEDLLSARFVYEYLSAYKEELLVPKMVGTANVSLTIAKIAEVPIPLVSQRSQSRLYELMALCDRLEASQAKRESRRNRLVSASVKRIGQSEDVGNSEEFRDHVRFHLHHLPRLATRPEHVKELRQTILNLAVRGKLVPQDPNDEPASELLLQVDVERHKIVRNGERRADFDCQEILQKEMTWDVPKSWQYRALSDLMLFIDYRGKTPVKTNSGIRLITAKNIRSGYLKFEPEEFISEDEYMSWMTRGIPRVGDVLFTTEAPMGNAAVVNFEERFALAQRSICFRLYSELDPFFVSLQINSAPFQSVLHFCPAKLEEIVC